MGQSMPKKAAGHMEHIYNRGSVVMFLNSANLKKKLKYCEF
jgi:hypothetical protein